MSYVEIRNIYKSFEKTDALANVSFDIKEGDRFGLIGPNGAGKTTLIDIMTGIVREDSGSVTIDGNVIPNNLVEVRSQIGYVPQEIALMEHLNAKNNLEYFGGLYGLSGKLLKERIAEALEVVGLSDTNKKKVKEFSGGMKRRLNIAAAVLHRPKFLILDEPTVGVDPQSRNKIFEFIIQLNKEQGTTILYTSHYMEEVEALSNTVFILDEGEQVAYGTQAEIKSMVQEELKWVLEVNLKQGEGFGQRVEINVPGIIQVTEENTEYHLVVDSEVFKSNDLLAFLQAENTEFVSLAKQDISLEDAFLQLTGKTLRD